MSENTNNCSLVDGMMIYQRLVDQQPIFMTTNIIASVLRVGPTLESTTRSNIYDVTTSGQCEMFAS